MVNDRKGGAQSIGFRNGLQIMEPFCETTSWG
jgi:hypothetical protein